jgi:hypothetical protein
MADDGEYFSLEVLVLYDHHIPDEAQRLLVPKLMSREQENIRTLMAGSFRYSLRYLMTWRLFTAVFSWTI